MLRFKDGTYQNWPRPFGIPNTKQNLDPCLAPYWSRVDETSFEDGCSKVCYKKYEDSNDEVFTTAANYGNTLLGRSFTPEWVMVVTWKDLRPSEAGTFGGVSAYYKY